MGITDIIKLIDAGFTKDDIIKLSSANIESTDRKPAPVAEVKNEELKKEEPKKEEAPAIGDEVNRAVAEAMKPFEDLYGKFSKLVNMPSMDNVQPKGIEDIFDSFFKGE